MYYENFDEAWQDILKVARQKEEIGTLAQQVSNRIVSTPDDSITVVSQKSRSKSERVLTRQKFEPYWDVLVEKDNLNFMEDLPRAQWLYVGAIITAFLAHLPCVEFAIKPRVLYLMPHPTHDLGTTRMLEEKIELKGIVPGHKALTKAERERLWKKATGSFKRAGIPEEWFKDFFHEEQKQSGAYRRE